MRCGGGFLLPIDVSKSSVVWWSVEVVTSPAIKCRQEGNQSIKLSQRSDVSANFNFLTLASVVRIDLSFSISQGNLSSYLLELRGLRCLDEEPHNSASNVGSSDHDSTRNLSLPLAWVDLAMLQNIGLQHVPEECMAVGATAADQCKAVPRLNW